MIQLGEHYRTSAPETQRETIRHFYTQVFECELHCSDDVTSNIPPNIDLFIFSSGHCFGVEFFPDKDPALSRKEHYLACWMEIRTENVELPKQKCLEHGAVEITDYWDKEHFYFHAPGGQVYRLIALDEGR
jgi:hypothetical protein